MLWSTKGPRIATNAAESGQLVENARDWEAPRTAGKERATTQAAQVTARMFPASDISMSLSTA